MSKYTATVTGNTSVYVCDIRRKRDMWQWSALVIASGTWGSGTITWEISPDDGVTKIPYKDISGNSVTSAADDNFTINCGSGSTNSDAPKLYATMAGATNPSVNIVVYDNNN